MCPETVEQGFDISGQRHLPAAFVPVAGVQQPEALRVQCLAWKVPQHIHQLLRCTGGRARPPPWPAGQSKRANSRSSHPVSVSSLIPVGSTICQRPSPSLKSSPKTNTFSMSDSGTSGGLGSP